MRMLAWFTGAFSVGIFLAQYLLPEAVLLPLAAVCFVFACAGAPIRTNPGRRILLVDDILTTGSTLSECALTLRAAGAREVFAVTLARSR